MQFIVNFAEKNRLIEVSKQRNKKIDIILPRRIGDAVLNIPMLLALKQLNEKYKDNNKIKIISQPFMAKLFASLDIFECVGVNNAIKAASNLFPAEIAFFTETINTNWGYNAKVKYGLTNTFKKIIKYDHEMPFMDINKLQQYIPANLIAFLKNKYQLGQYSISLFGIVLELGYSAEQIIETFDYNSESIAVKNFNGFSHPVMQDKYVVFCMEAAYGKKGDANRRWNENFYVEIARKCYEEFNLKSVFVGINKNFKVPNESYLIDLRKKLNLFQLAQVLKSAVYYIGNDTAPLHIANIMQTPSVGAYFMQHSITDFSPIFPKLNSIIFCPETSDDLYEKFKQEMTSEKNLLHCSKLSFNKPVKKTAIIFGAKIGDVVNVQPVCRELKKNFPDSQLVFATWPGAVEIAKLLPEVDCIEIFDNKGRGQNPFIFIKEALKIRFKHDIDLAVVINDSFTYALFAFLAGAKYIIGRHKPGKSFLFNRKYSLTRSDVTDVHVVKSYLKSIEPIGIKTSDYSIALKTDFELKDIEYIDSLIKNAGYADKRLIGFSPCSALEHKDWTPEEGKKLIDLINRNSDYKVVLTGDYIAQNYAAKIREMGTDDFLDMSGRTNIKQFLILLNKFKEFLTVDTGSAHLSYVFNIPTTVMFFVNHYKYWGPLDLNFHKIIYRPDKYSLKAEEVFKELNLTSEEPAGL